MVRRGSLVLLVLLLATALAGPAYAGRPAPPPTGTDFDYQLGGNRSVPDHVGIVVRDRQARAAAGLYNVCYINGFQTQPNEKRFWRKHWQLVLKKHGEPVVDEAWGEWLLDIRTGPKRKKLAGIMGRWIDRCAADGYAAVEFDNLDSFARSRRSDRPRRQHELRPQPGAAHARCRPRRRPEEPRAVGRQHRRFRLRDRRGVRALARVWRLRPPLRPARRSRSSTAPRTSGSPVANWAEKISVVRRDVALSSARRPHLVLTDVKHT